MSRSASDHPRVVVFPPLIPIVTIGLGFLLQWLVPLPLPAGVAQSWRMAIGAAAFAEAQDPVKMATAMKLAIEAGRLAYVAGRMRKRLYASASSPVEGAISASGS